MPVKKASTAMLGSPVCVEAGAERVGARREQHQVPGNVDVVPFDHADARQQRDDGADERHRGRADAVQLVGAQNARMVMKMIAARVSSQRSGPSLSCSSFSRAMPPSICGSFSRSSRGKM
jgi:hypothetical protein